MSRADEAADLLADIVERGKTSGRPGACHDLAELLATALDAYELARLAAVARARLGALNGAATRKAAIEAGTLRAADPRLRFDQGPAVRPGNG